MTKRESDEACRRVDEWWDTLGFNAKARFKSLVEAIENPPDPTLPMFYADDQTAIETFTISSCSCAIMCVHCNDPINVSPMCNKKSEHWAFHQACCGCE